MHNITKTFFRLMFKSAPILISFLLSASLVHAAEPLVEPAWLLANLDKPEMRILDLQSAAGYRQAHLPGAVNTGYAQWRVKDRHGVPQMLPEKDYLETLIGQLGIDNQTYVILTPVGAGAGDMAVATRIFWTFKAMGHDKISILNGGLLEYSRIPDSHFVREVDIPPIKQFNSQVRPGYFPDANEVKGALERGVTFVDSRSYGEYIGQIGGRGERAGTIPGSISLSYDRLMIEGSGRFHELSKIKEIYQSSRVPLQGEQISFCHTGHRTSLSWFVSHQLLGNKEARMYDGSTIEWATSANLPIEVLSE